MQSENTALACAPLPLPHRPRQAQAHRVGVGRAFQNAQHLADTRVQIAPRCVELGERVSHFEILRREGSRAFSHAACATAKESTSAAIMPSARWADGSSGAVAMGLSIRRKCLLRHPQRVKNAPPIDHQHHMSGFAPSPRSITQLH